MQACEADLNPQVGRGTDAHGRKWRWVYSRACGLIFVSRKGEVISSYPPDLDPIWEVIDGWIEAHQRGAHNAPTP